MKRIPFTKEAFGVQFITHYTEQYSYTDSARIALEGGCRWVQLRMKEATDEEWRQAIRQVSEMCRAHDAVFIVDDHTEYAQARLCQGVHLGKNDMPIAQARSLLGEGCIIGGTANTIDDILRHRQAGASYIGCGPFRFTTTKKNLSPTLGIEGYRRIITRMRAEGIGLPLVAIGGITAQDIPAIMEAGADGIALSGSILRADNPVEEMRRVVETVQRCRREQK